MEKFIINGGNKLNGSVILGGAKNAALPILAASIMLDGRCTIKNCPDLSDVQNSLEIIKHLGGFITKHKDSISIHYKKNGNTCVPLEMCNKMRSSILYIAPLLYRYASVSIYNPGGCNIGKRPIDIHLNGLKCMGAKIEIKDDVIFITRPKEGLKGIVYKLKVPSVGATQTLIMAASTAKGITILHNCAKEPEVIDLIDFLNKAGANIYYNHSGDIHIKGVSSLNAISHTLIPDRIIASTILSAVSACTGRVLIQNYPKEFMKEFEKEIKKSGIKILSFKDNAIVYKNKHKMFNINIKTGYYPDFPTDSGPLLAASFINNEGVFRLEETIFENRFSYKDSFEQLGLNCIVEANTYVQSLIENISYNTKLYAKDLRAGAAITVAAMAKNGTHEVYGVEFIDRGYEKLEDVFTKLGANIRREKVE